MTTQTTHMTAQPTVTLTVAKVGDRQFRAAVAYAAAPGGWLVGDTCAQRRTAIASLERKLVALGQAIPAWNVKTRDLSAQAAPATQPEATTAPAPEPVKPTVTTPATPATATDFDAKADAAERAIEAAPSALPSLPKSVNGIVTPFSDPGAWVAAFRAAVAYVSGIDLPEPRVEGLKPGQMRYERTRIFRETVDAILRAGRDGVRYAGAWDRAGNGTGDYNIRYTGEQDPTARQFHGRDRGQGVVRPDGVRVIEPVLTRPQQEAKEAGERVRAASAEAAAKTVAEFAASLGIRTTPATQPVAATTPVATQPVAQATQTVAPAGTDPVAELVAAVQASGAKTVGQWAQQTGAKVPRALRHEANVKLSRLARKSQPRSYVPVTAFDNEAVERAELVARAYSARAVEQGHDSDLWYKIGMCVSLRAQGATPHHKYEAALRAASISEEYILAEAGVLAKRAA